ncbi:unnamed protein product [Parnassius mnemosyne]|uniref:Uncharacterized protein n=1 Tax=Parnassius mnemosyne TaxID=213953 RepID=A0AAV1MB99_9NEOP
MSPKKKKPKLTDRGTSKRGIDADASFHKRSKSENCMVEMDIQTLKRKNFVKACEKVSYKAYLNYAKRFKLIYLPTCMHGFNCKHQNIKDGLNLKQMPSYAEESFKIEMKTNMWCEALEVCFLCITPTQYLSANVLINVVEIMLNAHGDPEAEFTISYLLEKCQQILSQNFSTHPPCLAKSIRKCYKNFLTSPMDLKENTFTNRAEFDCNKGTVKYCMNRLEYEISSESKDEALVDKYENIPEEMKESVKGLHWQKEKFEIFEALERTDRIKRLMAVLESIVELLQFDLAIWHSRYSNNLSCHIMRSHRPLMAFVLWSDNVLYTGAVNNNCRQILRIFVYMVHLQYPEAHIRIMTIWLNTIVQTFYICENGSNSDFPNTGKYCTAFAKEFYKIISGVPQVSINKILQRIQPTYMQYLIGIQHIQSVLLTDEENIIKIIIDFVENSQWENYEESSGTIEIVKNTAWKQRRVKKVASFLSKVIHKAQNANCLDSKNQDLFPKFDPKDIDNTTALKQNDIVSTLYLTLDSYLDAFSVQNVQETLDRLNEQLLQKGFMEEDITDSISEYSSYSVTEHFIKKYRSMYQMLKELMLALQKLKNNEQLPDVLKVFENIGLLEL